MVEAGEDIPAGKILVKIARKSAKAGDITGGLPRVTELFEARNPSNPMDKLIIADIEEDNTSSRRAFEVQGFQQQDSAKIQVKYGDGWEDYSTATPDKCVLVCKQVEAAGKAGAA